MPLAPAADVARVAINFISVTLEVGTNVFHFRKTTPGVTAETLDDLNVAVADWIDLRWAGVASDDWQSDLIVATDLTVAEGLQRQLLHTFNGTVASPSLPAQNTVAVSFRTGLTGRSRRGRAYHVGLAESMAEGSRLTLAAATNIPAQYFSLIATAALAGWTWGVLSYVENGVPRVTPLFTPITDCILVDTIIDSMDTRKPRP